MSRTKIKLQACRQGISFEDYLRIDAVSNSVLKDMARSPFRARYFYDNPKPSTEAMKVGTAIHYALLEPDLLDKRVKFKPEGFQRRSKEQKAMYAAWEAEYEMILPHAAEAVVYGIRDTVLTSPIGAEARKVLGLDGLTECAVTARDPVTGLMCKSRPDHLAAKGILVDVKTTSKEDAFMFARDVFSFGYDRQMAFYLDQLAWLFEAGRGPARFEKPEHAVLLIVQKEPPYEPGVFALDPEIIDVARGAYRYHLERYAECLETDYWPGAYEGVQNLKMEEWAKQARLAEAAGETR